MAAAFISMTPPLGCLVVRTVPVLGPRGVDQDHCRHSSRRVRRHSTRCSATSPSENSTQRSRRGFAAELPRIFYLPRDPAVLRSQRFDRLDELAPCDLLPGFPRGPGPPPPGWRLGQCRCSGVLVLAVRWGWERLSARVTSSGIIVPVDPCGQGRLGAETVSSQQRCQEVFCPPESSLAIGHGSPRLSDVA